MIGAGSLLPMDIPPFMMVIGRGECVGINLIGLRRSGRDSDTIHKLKDAYRLLYRSGKPFSKALDELAKAADCPESWSSAARTASAESPVAPPAGTASNEHSGPAPSAAIGANASQCP